MFLTVFPLFMPKSKLLICSFKKSHMSDSLTSIFTKEQPWAIRSRRSLTKNEKAIRSKKMIELLFRSFAHKKRAIRSKKPKSKFPTLVRSCVVQQADWYFGKKMGRVTTSLIYNQRVVMFNN